MITKRKQGVSTILLTNPLYAYVVGFAGSLLVFLLKWSHYYQALSDELLWFILGSSIFAILCGIFLRGKNKFRPIPISRHNNIYFWIIILGNLFEYIYCQNIPLLSVLLGLTNNYNEFEGIPMFHVFLSTFSLFYSIYIFHQYQSHLRNRQLLWMYLLLYIPQLLILNRGAVMTMIFASGICYFMRIERLMPKSILKIIASFFLILLGFGVIGDMRSTKSIEDDTYILRIGGATDEFINNNIPQGLFWSYLYIASPIGNLQNTLETTIPEANIENFIDLTISQSMPDFVGKRLTFLASSKKWDIEPHLVVRSLNAPSVFAIPYLMMGWYGIIYIFFFMIIVTFSYSILLKTSSPYFISGWSILSTIIILNTFNNMWHYGGLFVIFCPIVWNFFKRVKIKRSC